MQKNIFTISPECNYLEELAKFIQEYCIKNSLGQKQMSEVYNNNGHYGKKNYYKGYSRVN
jgi:hypothetical protein